MRAVRLANPKSISISVITGTKGRIKILKPSHHPTKLEIYSGGYEGSLGSWGEIGVHGYEGRRDGWNVRITRHPCR